MEYNIYRNSVVLCTVKPEDTSELEQVKQSKDIIKLNFNLNEYVDIQIGDYVYLEKTGYLYHINTEPNVIEKPEEYHYECVFEGSIHELRKTKAILQTVTELKTYKDYKFPLTGNAHTFLLFIVECLNREGATYSAGTWKSTETQTVSFNNWNIFEAITQLSTLLKFDWWMDGNVLHFDKKPYTSGILLHVGILSGLASLTRFRVENQNVETVVYGYGSTENIPPRTADVGDTYDSPLLTENRLAFVGVDGDSKLENNVNLYGRIESVQEFDEIKPEFTGTVTDIDSNKRIFYDPTINFVVNDYLVAGIPPKITFLTGTLIGKTFNVSIIPYYATNQITMDIVTDESGDYPNDIAKPAVGDLYKLFDIVMPPVYVTEAAARLQAATQEYLTKYSKAIEAYESALDKQFIQLHNIVLNLGDIIRVVSIKFGIDSLFPINTLTQKITDPFAYVIQFGDILPKGILSSLQLNNFSLEQEIYNVSNSQINTNTVNNIIGETTQWQLL